MCAEYTVGPQSELETLIQGLNILIKIIRDEPLGRIFPRGSAPILLKNEEQQYEIVPAEFSLIPAWWNPERADKKTKNNRPVFATHNARLESIDEKPTFKDSFQKRHCIVPIKAFFESSVFGERFAGNRIQLKHSGPLLAAGCHSTWLDKSTGELVTSFTIITHIPSRQIFECGHDRMPVFLSPRAATDWIDSSGQLKPQEAKSFLLEQNLRNKLEFEVSIDRELKKGWDKAAPEPEELFELSKIVSLN